MEMMPKKMQPHVTSTWSIQEVLIYVFCTVYFWKISKHWIYFCLGGYAWNIISLICLFWVPESPRYLASSGKLKEARIAFEQIARWNRVEDFKWDNSLFNSLETTSTT